MGMDPSSMMGGGGGGVMGMFGSGMSGYSQGVQPQQQQQQLTPMPMQQNMGLQQQEAGIAANQAQRNQSLLAAVQNLQSAQALGQPGAQPVAPQSQQVVPQQRQDQPNARQMPFLDATQALNNFGTGY
jgi:hypothetical protein